MSSISGMNKSKKYNESIRPSKRQKFKSHNRSGIISKEKGEKLEFNEVSEEELFLVKKQIHENLRKQKRNQISILILSIFISISILAYIFY